MVLRTRQLVWGLLAALPAMLPAAAGAQDSAREEALLTVQELPEAEVAVLEEEAGALEDIAVGVALSLAQCEGEVECDPAVTREELEQLVQTVDQRLTALAERHAETGDESLEAVLLSYADVRENYARYLEQVAAMETDAGDAPAADAFTDGAPAAAGTATAPGQLPEAYDIFEDADEALTDGPAAGDETP